MKNLILIISLLFILSSCGELNMQPTGDEIQSQQTRDAQSEALREVGAPNIVNFQELRLAKMITELRDQENILTYTYIVNLNGELIFMGESIGFGLPYSVQTTNPMRVYHEEGVNGRSATFIPQPEPNMLFMPEGLSATWIMLINPVTDEAQPVYIESEILVSPFPLH